MKYLLDTHILIWFLNGDSQLSKKLIQIIESEDSESYVSIASLWEIAIKISLKKLELNCDFNDIEKFIFENNFKILPLLFTDLLFLEELPFFHRDPFDRLLICQSVANDYTLISNDTQFQNYKLKLLY